MRNFRLTKEDYDEIKSHLTMRQVAKYYGYPSNSKGLCLCPFHKDTHPSMRLYEDRKGFYCFSCGVGGDVITFVARLFGINNEKAALQIINDFGLPVGIKLSYREDRERRKRQIRRREREAFIKDAVLWLTVYRQLLCEAARDPGRPHFEEALVELDIVEYRLECLKEYPEEYFNDRKAVNRIGAVKENVLRWFDVACAGETNAG